jgi:hypothetical protein
MDPNHPKKSCCFPSKKRCISWKIWNGPGSKLSTECARKRETVDLTSLLGMSQLHCWQTFLLKQLGVAKSLCSIILGHREGHIVHVVELGPGGALLGCQQSRAKAI